MKKIFVITFITLLLPTFAFARIGVGVGTGKIVVDQVLRPGLIYTLPSLTILNTGDEPSQYEVSTTYREGQVELKPEKDWFSFEPSSFYLEPGKVQTVQVKLTLPVKGARPGDYFIFLEGHPVKTSTLGGTSIGIAAAAKLYFAVAPSNIFAGIYYRVTSLFTEYSPWSYILLGVIVLVISSVILRRYFSFNIGLSVKKK